MIDYSYDALQRLTAADYSNGDYYHYTYDQVGNRLSQSSSIDSVEASVDYTYDDANRLDTVDAVSYTFDANGNLLDDGVNTYTYDPANRLSTVNGNISYAYTGLGDRIQQTVDSTTTTYVLDLNMGLTQVLDDGTNTYLYGNGRIAQVNSTTEYFLGDALGSVRQMADAAAVITLAKSYDPYGVESVTSGAGSTNYGFTGEQADANGLIYLRARYYSSDTGRFITRDTWDGDANIPMSYNKWEYVYDDPINKTDPTGNFFGNLDPCDLESYLGASLLATWLGQLPDYRGICIAEKNMDSGGYDYLNTYVAAGIAVQSQWYGWVKDSRYSPKYKYDETGLGCAQVSDIQMNTPYTEPIILKDNAGKPILDSNGKVQIKGYGLGLEGQDQMIPAVAVTAMWRRIRQVTDECTRAKCSSTDIFIASALAQNSSLDWKTVKLWTPNIKRKKSSTFAGITFDWDGIFLEVGDFGSHFELKLFSNDVRELRKRGWYVPQVDWAEIDRLKEGPGRKSMWQK